MKKIPISILVILLIGIVSAITITQLSPIGNIVTSNSSIGGLI
jgi:hypothetical protein